jgi:hypothetical protein
MARSSVQRRARRARPKTLESIPEIVARLHRGSGDFTPEQLTRACEKLRALCPSCEIHMFHRCPLGRAELTSVSFEVPMDEAEQLLGRERLPQPPYRLNHFADSIHTIRRVRGGMYVRAEINNGDAGPLAAFAPEAIRALVPAPRLTLQEWKEKLRARIERALNFGGPQTIDTALEFPLMPKFDRPEPEGGMLAALAEANNEFRLPESERKRLMAIFRAGHDQLARRLLAALETAKVEQLLRPALRVAGGRDAR